MARIRVAAWRDDETGPMQVISGPMGRPKLHFEAPPADRLPADTALRDINELLARGVLRKMAGGGRSTGYELHDQEA